MNVSISQERNTVLADNRKSVSISSIVKTAGSGGIGSSLTKNEENAAIAVGAVVGLGMTAGSFYAVYKAHYLLGLMLFISAGPIGFGSTIGIAYLLYRNDKTGV